MGNVDWEIGGREGRLGKLIGLAFGPVFVHSTRLSDSMTSSLEPVEDDNSPFFSMQTVKKIDLRRRGRNEQRKDPHSLGKRQRTR